MMLRRSIVKLMIGLMLLSNAANLLIFTAAGLTRGVPPLVPEGLTRPDGLSADPLPQALVLTAIVISFGVLGVRRGADPPRVRCGGHRRPAPAQEHRYVNPCSPCRS
jgi:hypothetical protein